MCWFGSARSVASPAGPDNLGRPETGRPSPPCPLFPRVAVGHIATDGSCAFDMVSFRSGPWAHSRDAGRRSVHPERVPGPIPCNSPGRALVRNPSRGCRTRDSRAAPSHRTPELAARSELATRGHSPGSRIGPAPPSSDQRIEGLTRRR